MNPYEEIDNLSAQELIDMSDEEVNKIEARKFKAIQEGNRG